MLCRHDQSVYRILAVYCLSLPSPLPSGNAFSGFSNHMVACFLGARITLTTDEDTGLRVSQWNTTANILLLPVRTAPVSSPAATGTSSSGSTGLY